MAASLSPLFKAMFAAAIERSTISWAPADISRTFSAPSRSPFSRSTADALTDGRQSVERLLDTSSSSDVRSARPPSANVSIIMTRTVELILPLYLSISPAKASGPPFEKAFPSRDFQT